MTRKDTIIVAVLINAGLLIVLFATALKSSSPIEEMAAAPAQLVPMEVPVQKEKGTLTGDEVDQVLSQYQAAATIAPAPAAPITAPPAVGFAQDLQVIGAQPAPAPVVEAPAVPAVVEVKVKKGDVLERIARHHHTSVDEIMKLNRLGSTQLKIGQVLKIPGKGVKASTEGGGQYYTVKNGDSPWSIANKNHMKLEELLKLNHLDEEKARKLKPGDQIRIR